MAELKRQFNDDIHDDYHALREALKLEAWQILPTKEILLSVFGGVAAVGGLLAGAPTPLPDVMTVTGAVVSIGGLLASRGKYVSSRRKVLREHPTSYLYKAGKELRI